MIAGSRVVAELNSKLLKFVNGGAGASAGAGGTISITNRGGVATNINLAGVQSVSDILTTINAAGAGVTASLNNAGNGLLITDIAVRSAYSAVFPRGGVITQINGVPVRTAADARQALRDDNVPNRASIWINGTNRRVSFLSP